MAIPRYLTSTLVISLALFGSSLAQRDENCDAQSSAISANKLDVHCNCMQRLDVNQMNLPIGKLTINQTGCNDTGLQLSWPDLENLVAPEVLVLAGATVFFSQNRPDRTWNASIKQLEFIDSEINELPAFVFRGMTLLEEVRLLGSSVEVIRSDAFSNHDQLKLVEIAHNTITKIEDHAFNNLPALEDLAITHSFIGSIESGAVSLFPSDENAEMPRCPGVGRSMPESMDTMDGIMGRGLNSLGNLTLPEYGTRFLLFKNNIININTKGISSKTLGFLIVGQNHIVNIEREAFDMELYNECEISAAIFVGNTIDTLASHALLGLKGKDGASYQTFLAIANNTFTSVFAEGFRLSGSIVIFAVDENKFDCDCNGLGWILSGSMSQNQQELEKEIISKATCLDGTNLISFTSSCTDHGKTTEAAVTTHSNTTPMRITGRPPVTTGRPPVTTTPPGTETSGASTITLTTSVITFIMCCLLL